MLKIYADCDSCPVKDEILKVADRYDLNVYMVSNSGLRPVRNPKVEIIVVPSGPDAADDWIAQRSGDGDIVITADILLAARCIKNNSSVISPAGNQFTDDNIGNAVAGRSLSAHLRELGYEGGGNSSFTKKDRSKFLQELDRVIQSIKRR
ncbi:YaiI/YqxD family protein [Rickettsiales bacterium]|nr:YaiI/YqxD family protein [Rickettsiales bacterium]